MVKRKVTIINRTKFATKDISEIATALLEGQLAPSFYLLCPDISCDGITLTNLDKPTIIIFIKDLEQFAKIFVHELTHLLQHSNDYTDEEECYQREVVISDVNNPKGITIINPTEVSLNSSHE